jgi:hypothetical protein
MGNIFSSQPSHILVCDYVATKKNPILIVLPNFNGVNYITRFALKTFQSQMSFGMNE